MAENNTQKLSSDLHTHRRAHKHAFTHTYKNKGTENTEHISPINPKIALFYTYLCEFKAIYWNMPPQLTENWPDSYTQYRSNSTLQSTHCRQQGLREHEMVQTRTGTRLHIHFPTPRPAPSPCWTFLRLPFFSKSQQLCLRQAE